MEYVDIRSILICSIITSDEKNYKYFIGYEDNNYKVKPLCIRLQRTSANVKDYDGETKLMSFLLKMMICWKHIMILGIKSVPVIEKNLIVNPSTIKFLKKQDYVLRWRGYRFS